MTDIFIMIGIFAVTIGLRLMGVPVLVIVFSEMGLGVLLICLSIYSHRDEIKQAWKEAKK